MTFDDIDIHSLDMVPVLKSNILLQEETFGAALIDIENDKFKLISSFEAFILALFDGKRDLKDLMLIFKYLKSSPDDNEILTDIVKFIKKRNKYVEFMKSSQKIINQNPHPKIFLSKSCDLFSPPNRFSKPRNLVLYVTRRCNLNCVYCFANATFAGSDKLNTTQELSTKKILELIEQIAELGIKSVTVTGGEPTLRDDLTEILDNLKRREIDVFLATNAVAVDDGIAHELKKNGIKKIQAKLDAADAQLQDRLSGVKGSYDKLINGIEIFAEHSFSVSVASVITSWNIKDFPQVVEKCLELGAAEIKPKIYMSGIFSSTNRGGSYLNPPLESLLLLEKTIEELRCEYGKRIEISRLDFSKMEINRERNMPLCPGLISTCCVMDNGQVTPCEMLSDFNDNFIIGNVKSERLIDIWNSKKADNWVARKNIDIGESCRSCEEFIRCKGGCPWKAIVSHGSWQCDPTCVRSPSPKKISFAEAPNRLQFS